MAVGDSSLFAGESYLAVGRETTYGTYNTCTASLEFLSSSIKMLKDTKILQQVERNRAMSKAFSLGRVVEGDLEFYMYPEDLACGYILQNAFGGTITTATATGETTGGTALTHEFRPGSMNQSYTSICINMRKGPSSGGKVFQYSGGKVNSLSFAAELDEPVVITASMIFKDATAGTDVEAALTSTALECLSFANGRFSAEQTTAVANLTTTSYWHVQSVNFSLNNNLKNDTTSRRIGSDTIDVLPIGIQSYELSVNMRFNTTTAYDAMIAQSSFVGEFEFLGSTISGSAARRGMKVRFQKLTIKDAGDPEVGGPDETLQSTVTFNVLRSESAGYAVSAFLTNVVTSYA
jgi:hypothetical protein